MTEILLQNIRANAHPKGNRIDLSWLLPEGGVAKGVLIRRSKREYPTHPSDGVLVSDVQDASSYSDEGLESGTVYYYAFFPYTGTPPVYFVSRQNIGSALSTAPYGNADQMYDLLPRIYHRYDTTLPPDPGIVDEEYRDRGQLRRFLGIAGEQLDRLQSIARTVLDLHDPQNVGGGLLPLLAEWIGWDTDFRLGYGSQRSEISNAPFIYERIGIIPTVEATVKRLIGWESRTKEFFQNVFLTNRPEQLNIRGVSRTGGIWEPADRLLSLDYNYDGRGSALICKDGRTRLFYHTQRRDRWNIWMKESDAAGVWTPGRPVTDREGVDKYPTAAYAGDALWVFWNTYDEAACSWMIQGGSFAGGGQLKPETILDVSASRRFPAACTDADGGAWLFWIEGTELKYRTYNNGWNVTTIAFPDDGGSSPNVEAEPFVMSLKSEKSLYVFWASRTEVEGKKTWRISYRKKSNLTADGSGWGPVKSIAGLGDRDDREPAPVLNEDGTIELFWSSNRSGNWLIWSSVLEDPATDTWAVPAQVLPSDYNQRAPVPVISGQNLQLFFGSNAGVAYQSSVYTATETIDNRYAGSTMVDTGNARKNNLQGDFTDFAVYTYDTGTGRSNFYSRDAVGVYLTPDTENPELINRNVGRLSFALAKFMPAQARPVFIIETPIYREHVYSRDPEKGRDIGEYVSSEFEVPSSDTYSGATGSYTDALPDWVWINTTNTATGEFVDHRSADLSANPPVTKYRIWHTGINRGG